MTPRPISPLSAGAALFSLALAATPSAWAQTPPASQIAQVTLYPGSAKVERVAKVAAGAKTLVFTCLPAALDVPSLAVSADGYSATG